MLGRPSGALDGTAAAAAAGLAVGPFTGLVRAGGTVEHVSESLFPTCASPQGRVGVCWQYQDVGGPQTIFAQAAMRASALTVFQFLVVAEMPRLFSKNVLLSLVRP